MYFVPYKLRSSLLAFCGEEAEGCRKSSQFGTSTVHGSSVGVYETLLVDASSCRWRRKCSGSGVL